MVGQRRMPWIAGFLLLGLVCTSVFSKQTDRSPNESCPRSSAGLYIECYGSGPPIVMLHGFGGNVYTWRHLIGPLSKSNELILIDLKGFGKSPKPKDNLYRLQDQAKLIYQFIDENNLRGLTLVGHSLGGVIALLVSLELIEKPEALSKLVMLDSAGYRQALPTFIRILRIPIVRSIPFPSNKKKVRLSLKKAYFHDEKITEEQVSAYAKPLDSDGAKHALVKTAKSLRPSDIEETSRRYREITVPTLIIWGRYDEVVPLKVGEKLHAAIPNSALEIIENCGHIPHEEKPDETIEKLLIFLQEHKGRGIPLKGQ